MSGLFTTISTSMYVQEGHSVLWNGVGARASTGPGTGPRGATFKAGEKVGGYLGLRARAKIHGYSGLLGL